MRELRDLNDTLKKRQERDWSSRPGSVSCRYLEQPVDKRNLDVVYLCSYIPSIHQEVGRPSASRGVETTWSRALRIE